MVPDLGQTTLFALIAFQLAFCAIFLTGMYPAAARTRSMQHTGGAVLVTLCLLTTFPLLTSVVWVAKSIEWPILVIGGGLAFLLAPLIYQAVPERISEGPVGGAIMVLINAFLLGTAAFATGLI